MSRRSKLTHLQKLTDDFGVWQHFEKDQILRKEGYALDDSARALIVYLLYKDFQNAEICLQYLENSFKDGQFIGFYYEDRTIRVFPSSEDALGLTLWALAFSASNNFEIERCLNLINKSNFEILLNSRYVRTLSYACIGYSLLQNQKTAEKVFTKIHKLFNENLNWFEETLTYANAIIPYALMTFIKEFDIKNSGIETTIEKSIETLEKYMKIGEIPSPVGNRLWQKIGEDYRDTYGQQPIDSAYMVLMYCKHYEIFQDEESLAEAKRWMDWFYGNNIIKKTLINKDYACADGIDESGINENRGAESTIVYLWAEEEYLNIIDRKDENRNIISN